MNYLENLNQDFRYAIRTLGKSPGFAVVIIVTLALSIGANSAIFSVIDGVLLRPLPFPEADRIVRVFLTNPTYPKFPLNPFDLRDFRARNRSFESLAAFTRQDLQLSGAGEPERLAGFRITAGYFRVLGLRPARGREFTANDELPGNGRVVILSNRIWRTRFAADPNIVGRKVTLDSQPFTVTGVMPPGAEHPGNEYHTVADGETVDVWSPFTFEGNPGNRGSHYMDGIGRLQKGVRAQQAQAEMNTLLAQMAREHPDGDSGWHVLVVPLYQELVGPSQRLLLVLLGAVALVLLIACANAANLLLARATARQREIAVRAALGASRSRLARQMLAESLLISLLGGGFGVAVAVGGVRALVALLPANFPRAHAIQVNMGVFWFTLLIALATGVLFGLAPALQAMGTDLQQGLRESGRGSTGSRRHRWLRNLLVVGELSLASLLLIGAGLLLRSFANLVRTDPGFRPERVLTASLSLPNSHYKTAGAISFFDRLITNLESVPGVRAAGAASDLPWTGYDENVGGFQIEGKKAPPNEEFHARYHVATPDYFRALGIPLLRGRFFTAHDNTSAPLKLIINESMARRYWPGGDPVGSRITFDDAPKEKDWMTIVGVVGDVKDRPNSAAAEPAFWWSVLQEPFFIPDMSIVVRANSDPALVADRVRVAVHELDPALAVAEIRLMNEVADASFSTPRFTLFLVALFAGLALTLAAIGMYGVISYSVSQRTHEFGLRMALGARPWDVLRQVLGQGMRLAVLGAGLGVVSALALGRILKSLLYEVSSADPLTFAAVAFVAVAIAALACYAPARRATSADPMSALRSE